MTLQDFSRDVVPVLQTILASLGLISLVLMWQQMKQTTLWNKLGFQQHFLDAARSGEVQRSLDAAATRIGVPLERANPFSESEVAAILHDDEARFAAKMYLNELEVLCAAIQIGVLDSDWAYATYGPRVTIAYRIWLPYIHGARRRYKSDQILIELERTANKWALGLPAVSTNKWWQRTKFEPGVERKV